MLKSIEENENFLSDTISLFPFKIKFNMNNTQN